jgi:hypothetical protein
LPIWYTDWYSRNNAGFICLYDTPTGTAETMLASFVNMIHRLVQANIVSAVPVGVSYWQMKPALFLLYQSVYHIDKWSQHCFCCTSDWYSRNNVGFICLYDTLTGTAETILASFVYMIHRLIQQKQCWLHLFIWHTDWYSRSNVGFICYRQMKPALFLLYQSVYHIDKWSQHCFCCTSRCII